MFVCVVYIGMRWIVFWCVSNKNFLQYTLYTNLMNELLTIEQRNKKRTTTIIVRYIKKNEKKNWFCACVYWCRCWNWKKKRIKTVAVWYFKVQPNSHICVINGTKCNLHLSWIFLRCCFWYFLFDKLINSIYIPYQ